ncbi:tetratricopeptide repeat protein [Candidatus Dependentiae bacterium]
MKRSSLAFSLLFINLFSLLFTNAQAADKTAIGNEYLKLAQHFMTEHNIEKAITYFRNALELDPQHALANFGIAEALFKQKKYEEALVHIKHAATQLPDNTEIMLLFGKTLRSLDFFEEAIEQFTNILHQEPTNILPLFEIANTYNFQGETEKALLCYEKTLELRPDIRQVRYNYAHTLKKMGRVEEAIKLYEEIIEDHPDYATVHFSLALAYLSLGDFKLGWPEYEWRWKAYKESPKKFPQPLWDGSNPSGKKVLLYSEQGLGDTFQFIRYAKLLKDLGATVIFQSQKPAADLLKQCDYIDQIIIRGKSLPAFDLQAPLMSLPMIFNTTPETVPHDIPYLHADPELVDYWSSKLAQDDAQHGRTNPFRIGICWQGNATYRSQALRHSVSAKSISLATFAPIANIPGVVLYSLQKVNGQDQIEKVDFELHTFGPELDTQHGRFMDTAAIMKNLDLVLTIDTSISHVAGALGVPTWLMLPNPADWRWIIGRDDTPWYPTNMRLFKQPSPGDWDTVICNVIDELQKMLDGTPLPAEQHLPFEELLDQMIILKIKAELTSDLTTWEMAHHKLDNLQLEIDDLEKLYRNTVTPPQIYELTRRLDEVNRILLKKEMEIASATQEYERAKKRKSSIKAEIKNLLHPANH